MTLRQPLGLRKCNPAKFDLCTKESVRAEGGHGEWGICAEMNPRTFSLAENRIDRTLIRDIDGPHHGSERIANT